MEEKKAVFIIDIITNIIDVYFGTFFVLYFLQVVNYEIVPLAKYYIVLYSCIAIGFTIIRKTIKQDVKVPYLRIGIALRALYIALIMFFRDNLVNYIVLIGIIKGIGDGFYYFPKNILNTEKIDNNERQKFSGLIETINQIMAIVIPSILGISLTFISYVNLGKIFFVLFIVQFIVSFYVKDKEHNLNKKFDLKGLRKIIKENKNVRYAIFIPILAGLTYSSGVMDIIIKIFTITNFKSSIYIGIVDSICSILSLISCILFIKIKKDKFPLVFKITGLLSVLIILLFTFNPIEPLLIVYLIARYSLLKIFIVMEEFVRTNHSNGDELKEFKTEYYYISDIFYAISRVLGYLILFIVGTLFGVEYISYILVICAIALFIQLIITIPLSESA